MPFNKSSFKPAFLLATLIMVLCLLAAILNFVRLVDAAKSALWAVLISVLIFTLSAKLSVRSKHLIWWFFTVFFVFDLGVQGVLRGFFGASPAPSILAESLANTSTAESYNFLLNQATSIAKSLGFVAISYVLIAIFTRKYFSGLCELSNTSLRWTAILIIVFLALHFNPTMLRQEPLLRWPVVYARHLAVQQDITEAEGLRDQLKKQESGWELKTKQSVSTKTVVLVIGESANRKNWSWYGYSRATTQPLEKTLSELPGHTIRWTKASSGQAYTLPSLRLALTPADELQPNAWKTAPDVFLLAKAAGYNVTWLSNQPAFEGWLSLLGKSADTSQFVNSGNWRDSSTTDFDLLPPFRKTLEKTPPEKELIVLHLLGQHFHYDLRCPNDTKLRPFSNVVDDEVMQSMLAMGRTERVRMSRNAYDNAVFCGSVFLSKTVQMLQSARTGRDIEFVYFSDHGQEVGHTQNFSGHSEQSENGYSVPLFLWSNRLLTPKGKFAGIARKDGDVIDDTIEYSINHLDHLLQGALGISSKWYKADLDPVQR